MKDLPGHVQELRLELERFGDVNGVRSRALATEYRKLGPPPIVTILEMIAADPTGIVHNDLATAYVSMSMAASTVLPDAVAAVVADASRIVVFGELIVSSISTATWNELRGAFQARP